MVDTTELVTAGKLGDAGDAIHCLTIPLHEEVALLPNAAIAEIIAYSEADAVTDAPEWFIGFIPWREYKVPLISFEAISGKRFEAAKKNSRIAVLNTLNGNASLPYFALLSQGIPSIALVQEEGIEESDASAGRMAVGRTVNLGGVEALIPDIDDVEQRLLNLRLI